MLDHSHATASWAKIYGGGIWQRYLALRDPVQQLRTRPGLDSEPWFRPWNWMVDYAVYMCPVRHRLAFALIDQAGRYWLHEEWDLAGQLYRDDTLDEWRHGDGSTMPWPCPVRADGGGHRPRVQDAPRLCWDMLTGWQLSDVANITREIAIEFMGRIDSDGGLVVPGSMVEGENNDPTDFAYLANDMPVGAYFLARAQAVVTFDDYYGVGSFLKSAKTARTRHLIRIAALKKQWEKRHLGVKAAEWEGVPSGRYQALQAPDDDELRSLACGDFFAKGAYLGDFR